MEGARFLRRRHHHARARYWRVLGDVQWFRASLFRAPPFPEPKRLVIVSITEREAGAPLRQLTVSNEAYDFIRSSASSFESIAAFIAPSFNVTGYDQSERVDGEIVSASYFRVLGASAASGAPNEAKRPTKARRTSSATNSAAKTKSSAKKAPAKNSSAKNTSAKKGAAKKAR